jgi:hypothetical protein
MRAIAQNGQLGNHILSGINKARLDNVFENWNKSVGKKSPKFSIPNQQYPSRIAYKKNSRDTFTAVANTVNSTLSFDREYAALEKTPGCTDYSPEPEKTHIK